MFASKSTRGFYNAAIHANMPEDVVEITKEHHTQLLKGQGAGKVIDWDDQGLPVLIDPPPPCFEQLVIAERSWRDTEIERIKWMCERHRDELELSSPTSLRTEQYRELLTYLQLLRDWPQSLDFPAQELRPVQPSWLAEQAQ